MPVFKGSESHWMLKGNWLAALLVCFEQMRICRLNSTSTRWLCRLHLLSDWKSTFVSCRWPLMTREQRRKRINKLILFLWLPVVALIIKLIMAAYSGDAANSPSYCCSSTERSRLPQTHQLKPVCLVSSCFFFYFLFLSLSCELWLRRSDIYTWIHFTAFFLKAKMQLGSTENVSFRWVMKLMWEAVNLFTRLIGWTVYDRDW